MPKAALPAPVRLIGFGVLLAAWLALAHFTTAPAQPSDLGAAVAVLPYLGVALWMAWRATRRGPALLAWAAVAAIVALAWPLFRERFEWIYLAQHLGSFMLLALGFGRSLAPGGDPMIARFARIVHGELAPPLARYTRAATLAWTLFFASIAAASLLLFTVGPFAWWSLLVNVLTPILIGAMFVAEYLARCVLLPAELRTGLLESVQAFVAASRQGRPLA